MCSPSTLELTYMDKLEYLILNGTIEDISSSKDTDARISFECHYKHRSGMKVSTCAFSFEEVIDIIYGGVMNERMSMVVPLKSEHKIWKDSHATADHCNKVNPTIYEE